MSFQKIISFLVSAFVQIKKIINSHKKISILAAFIILILSYQGIKVLTTSTVAPTYVIGSVQRGTIVSVVTGTGQVAASSQIDLKSKASGDLLSILPADGKQLKTGDIIARLDSKDAAISLQNAQISLAKLTKAPDVLSVTQAQNDVLNAKQTYTKAQDTLSTSYTTGLSNVASTFIELPSIVEGMNTLFYTQTGTLSSVSTSHIPDTARTYADQASYNFSQAKGAYDTNLSDYKLITAQSSTSSIERLIQETLTTTRNLTLAVKDAKNTLDYLQNINDESLKNTTQAQTNLNNWLGILSTHVSDLTNVYNAIQDNKNTIDSSARDIIAKQQSLDKLINGADPLDIEQQQLALTQQQYSYDNYFIRAPFDGIIAKTGVNKGDFVSNGTTVATFISNQQIAIITLNEVDVAKVKIGDKVTLTFDAVDNLTITGKVVEVDLAGAVSQGVVTYGVKIAFDTTDDRVRSGMSVNAAIATDIHQDVLVVPNSAIKSKGANSYVEVVDPTVAISTTPADAKTLTTTPVQKPVMVNLSDDINTEVTGLSEGDKIVVKTISGGSTSGSAVNKTPSLLNAAGVRTSGGTPRGF